MTIQGIIVTTLSTVLPVLGPVFGLNITAELVHQLGDNVVTFGAGGRRADRHHHGDLRPPAHQHAPGAAPGHAQHVTDARSASRSAAAPCIIAAETGSDPSP